eukprot:GEZU01023954.1.p1 GENE.GEZU01023954.1~~GEZU01023954.1.p1  ORF type:complete len:358 (+),score=70.23 GEZU01023954.1:98-1075(+)
MALHSQLHGSPGRLMALCLIVVVVVVSSIATCAVHAYKPVIMMHGILSTERDFDHVEKLIQQIHPGTFTLSLPIFTGNDSVETPMWTQVQGYIEYLTQVINNNTDVFEDGFHIIAHSQGALLSRAVLQTWSDRSSIKGAQVDTFISLAGPQMGQYGLVGDVGKYGIVAKELAYLLLYNDYAQDSLSFASYWNDPYHQAAYFKHSQFLAVINNQTYNPKSQDYKQNFMQVQKAVFFGSDGDEIIQPWQSSLWGFWNTTADGNPFASNSLYIVPMEKQPLFTEDWLGLGQMFAEGRLVVQAVSGIPHAGWLHNTNNVFFDYIAPLLT